MGYDQRVRGWLAGLLVTLAASGGCDNAPKKLACGQSIAQACATAGSCALTWAEAQSDTSFCPGATETSPLRADCGDTHAVTVKVGADSHTYYYDAAPDGGSGMLIAIVTAHGASATTTCDAGPTAGFTLPTCAGSGSEPLPQCFDGGVADGATD